MAVVDATSVDQVALNPDGRVLLVMTEARRYASGDVAAMAEDLRQKLNAYVHVIRSGQVRQLVGRVKFRGVDIRLYCFDEPPEPVREMITVAAAGLKSEGVGLDWVVHVPSVDDCLAVIGRSLADRAPDGWSEIELSASLVGDGLVGGLVARLGSGAESVMDPDQALIGALRDLKRARWNPDDGTWLTFRAVITGQQLRPFFDHDREPPGGVGEFRPEDWAEELRRYPRASVPDWWRDQLAADGPPGR